MKAAPKTAAWNSLTLLSTPPDRRVHISNGMGIAVPVGWGSSMPEKELIVYLQAGSADLAILEPVEFHQIILIVVLIGAVAALFFSIFYWLLKKLFCSKSARMHSQRGLLG